MKTVKRALDIIELLYNEKKGLGATEIANKLDTNKTTVYKIASVLCKYRYLIKNPETAKYQIGTKFVEIGSNVLGEMDVRTAASPFMKELAKATGETINLMVLCGTRGIYIEILESEKSAKLSSTVGSVDYLHISAVGKILLAYMPEDQKEYIIRTEGLAKAGKNTITDATVLEQELKNIRKKGYAIDDEESTDGARCVAAPIFNKNNEVIAALSISGLTIDISINKLNSIYAKLIIEAANKVTRIMQSNFN